MTCGCTPERECGTCALNRYKLAQLQARDRARAEQDLMLSRLFLYVCFPLLLIIAVVSAITHTSPFGAP